MTDHIIRDLASLEALYGPVNEVSALKEIGYLHPHYAAFIKASPFAMLATAGPHGLDASPRGDPPGFVEIADEHTLLVADRRGNNRIDSLRNIVCDPRASLLFLIPGIGTTLRVNGRAVLSIDPDLLNSFAIKGKSPRSVIVLAVDDVYFQCARAIVRSDLWNPQKYRDPALLPTPGQILASLGEDRVGGVDYDRTWPQRAAKSLW